jgi:hypothetical protein
MGVGEHSAGRDHLLEQMPVVDAPMVDARAAG